MKASFKVQRLLEEKERPRKHVESAARLQCTVLNNPRNFPVSTLVPLKIPPDDWFDVHETFSRGPPNQFFSPMVGPYDPLSQSGPPSWAQVRLSQLTHLFSLHLGIIVLSSNFHIKSICYTIFNNYQ